MRFLLGFAASLVACLAILGGAFWLTSDHINPYADVGWTANIIKRRADLLDRSPPGKLIIFAGSAGLFGVSAEILGRETGMKTINASSHAGMQWPLLDVLILSRIKKGDTVLMPLEMEYFGLGREWPNSLTAETGHSVNLEYFWSLPAGQKAAYFRLLSTTFLARQLKDILTRQPLVHPNFGYWAFADLPNGDINTAAAGNYPDAVVAYENSILVPAELDRGSKALVCRSVERLKARGVRVIATPPNIFLQGENKEHYLAVILPSMKAVFEECGAEFVADATLGMQDLKVMFDTNYHLIAAGRAARTELLAKALCASALHCSPTANKSASP